MRTMRAVQVAAFGGPETMRVVEIPVPRPAPGELLVRLRYAGVNFADSHFREGGRGGTPPFVLGVEGVGEVAACGAEVKGWAEGERVVYWNPVPGSYAEYAVVPAWRAVRVPDGVPSDVACALMVQGATAHYLTHDTFPLSSGQTCLILAAAGGVGQIMIQLARMRGARVIAIVGSSAKADVARARGAHVVLNHRAVDFADAARELTQGEGVDVVYDSVGADTYLRSIAAVRRRGMCVIFGMASGLVPPFDTALLNQSGSIFLARPNMIHHLATEHEIHRRMSCLFALYEQRQLSVSVECKYLLDDAVLAHRMMSNRESIGKCILHVS